MLTDLSSKIHIPSCIKYIYNILKKNIKWSISWVIKKNSIRNLLLIKEKTKLIDFVFLGHVDVVSEGHMFFWKSFPYRIFKLKNMIFSRGVCDMKGSICAFISQFLKFKKIYKNFAFIISGDEEREASYGCRIVSKFLKQNNFYIKNCLVGEPTSEKYTGDVVKTGRRGSLNLQFIIKSEQTHTAYNNKKNVIYTSSKFIKKIYYFNKTIKNFSSQVTFFKSTSLENNVTPCVSDIKLNIRFLKKKSFNFFLKKVISFFKKRNIDFFIKLNGRVSFPFINKNNFFLKKINKNFVVKNYKGGTSDGRFLNKITNSLVEIGLINKNIHKVNEYIFIKDYLNIKKIYFKIIKKINSI